MHGQQNVIFVKRLLLMGLVRRKFMRVEVLIAVSVQITVFWAVTCSSLEFMASIVYHEEGGRRLLHMVPTTELHTILSLKAVILIRSMNSVTKLWLLIVVSGIYIVVPTEWPLRQHRTFSEVCKQFLSLDMV
jgi:hypothetical protein